MSQPEAIEPSSVSADGTSRSVFSIVRLGPHHCDLVETLLLALDEDSRKNRFGGVTCDTGIRVHAKRASDEATMLLGAFAGRRLCAVLEAYACDTCDLEVALVVELGLRRRGIGWSLLNSAIEQGALDGATQLQLIFAADNWAMRRIAQKADARLDLVFGQLRAKIELCRSLAKDASVAERELIGN